MPVPSYRVPVKVARGTYSNLSSNVGSLEEGEICYANDENAIYVIEGGALTKATADLSTSSIGDLSDVDTTTVAPTDGQLLKWNNVNSEWEPGDILLSDPSPALSADLDVVTYYITTTTTNGNIEVAANGTGSFVVRGNTNSGKLVLNCETNTHGVSISSPPHSAAATYDLVLPGTAGTANQVLKTDGSGNLDWVDQTAGVSSIDDLSDVDTTTVAPTDGQALVWDNANSQWEPGTVSGGGGSSARSTVTQTTASLANGAAANATFSSTGKSGQFIKITTDRAAWVTLYSTIAARTADSSRLETVDPTAGSGVVLEVITTGADTVQVTPTAGYYNDESTPLSELYAKIVNKSGAASTVQVDIVLLPLEA